MIGTEVETLEGGQPVRLGCKLPDVLRFSAVPTWAESNEVLDPSAWEEHDDGAALAHPIKTQPFNNCTNAALAGLVELLAALTGDPITARSQVMLYWMLNGGRDEGAFCRDLADKLRTVGLCSAALAPADRAVSSPSAAALEDAKGCRALEVYQCLSWEEVASALSRRFLVYHGFCLGKAFFNTRSDGIVPQFDGYRANGHAMYSRGLRKIGGVWRAAVPNTWGTNFGAQGIGYIDKSYFWGQSGNFVNLDCYAIRSLRGSTDGIPSAKI